MRALPTTTASFAIPSQHTRTSAPTPRDLVMRLEQNRPALPNGQDERLVGYGVIGMAFASGHVLGLRRWPASSIGPAYTSVWHRAPDGRWSFFSDVAPEMACTRYVSAAVDVVRTTYVGMAWTGPRTLVVDVPAAAIHWTLSLEETAMTRFFGTMRRHLPEHWLASERGLSALGTCARVGLGTGPVRLSGRMPNGQRYRVSPAGLWAISAARATVRGEDVGQPGACGPQATLGDFLIPRRPLFALATARFDAFDPARHLAVDAGSRGRLSDAA